MLIKDGMEQFPEIGQRYLIIEEFLIMYKYFLKRGD